MGKGMVKGFIIALSFGLGVAIMLSMYGVIAAIVGSVVVGSVGAPLEVVKNWTYFLAGIAAYLFALGELGFIKFRMPSYSGAAPQFIQKQKDYLKAFFLGLFLGNIGVGCPHPATPLILVEIARSGDIFYGWSLFFVHAIGRVLPLFLLAFLAILGVNALTWLTAHREKVERATGWMMIFVAGFILTLGLFTHAWWVNSGQHTLLEAVTQEETLLNILGTKLGTGNAHHHGIETGTGLLGLPLSWGNWFLVLLWIIPLWWYYSKKKKEVSSKL
jgi:cytochrome c biogenesis protein CcdA